MAAAEQAEKRGSRRKKWFVFWTFSGQEKKAQRLLEKIIEEKHLQDKVSKVLVPTQTIPKVRKGKRIIQEKPLFRGYVLVEMEEDPELIHMLTSVGALRALISKDKALTTLSEVEVAQILETVEREQRKRAQEVPFLKGETVRVVEGPFTDFTGTVEEVYPERGKLKVLVSIFGRTTPVVLDFMQVERV